MTIFSTTGSKLYIGTPQSGDLTIEDYLALDTGSQATGTIKFSDQPADASTVSINSVSVEFVTTPASGKVTIADNLADTLAALTTFCETSSVAGLMACHFSNNSLDTLTITAAAGGVGGNAFALTAGGTSNGVASGTHLAGGGLSAWTEVNEISNLGAFGDTSSAITFSSIADGRVRKMKGARDAGSIALTVGMDARDLGQLALSAAQTTSYYFAFKVIANDMRLPSDTPSTFYFNGLVDSEKMTFGANNVVVTIAYTININTEILWTPSAAAA